MKKSAVAAGGVALVAVFGLIPAGRAVAQAPSEQGWWTTANSGPPPGGLPAPPSATPDVPSDGLLVEGGPQSPTAYSALVYEFSSGATVGSLTLAVAPNTVTTPNTTLELCPLKDTVMNSEQGGPMSDAPAYTCTKNVTAQAANGAYKFDVSSLVSDSAVAVAVLPTNPTDRVVFSKPDDNSLQVQGGLSSSGSDQSSLGSLPSSDQSVSASPSSPTASATAPASLPTGTAIQPVASPGLANLPANSAPPASTAKATSGGSAPPIASQFPAVASFTSSPAKPLAVVLVILAVVIGTIAWSGAGRAAVRRAVNQQRRPGSAELA